MGLGDGIRELVADVGVQTEDINTAQVTNAKLGTDVAKTIQVTAGPLTAAATAFYTWAATAAINVIDACLQVVSAGTTGALSLSNTTGMTMIELMATTTVLTMAKATGWATVAAGGNLELHCTASQANSAVCTLIFTYMNQQ